MESEITISSIVFIVMLIVPGVFFKRFYFRGQFTKQFTNGLFADRLITSIFWGLIVQVITFLLFNKSLNLSYEKIKKPVSSVYANLAKNSMPDLSTENFTYLLAYLLASIFVAALLGCLSHGFIRFFKIDSKFEVFRFANHWNYYFKGDSMDFGEFKSRKTGKVLSTSIDIVMEDGSGKTKMFSGFLTQYQISAESGALESLYLTDAKRYSTTSGAFKPVPGDCLVIPYNKVVDMNIRYNIRVVNRTFYNKIIQAVIVLISISSFIFLAVYPWFLEINLWQKILGIICSILTWLLVVTLLNQIFRGPGASNSTLDRKGITAIIIFILILSFCSVSLFGISLVEVIRALLNKFL